MSKDANADSGVGPDIDLAHLVQELSDLVRFTIECEELELTSASSFVDIHKKLLTIKKQINTFQENYKQDLAQVGLTPEAVRPTPEEIENLRPKDKKIWQQLQTMQDMCEEARERIHESLQASPEGVKKVKDELKDKDKEATRRKSSFKKVGGKKGWLPS